MLYLKKYQVVYKKIMCIGICILFCMIMINCQGSMGYDSDVGWYFCNTWFWETGPKPPCPPEYSNDPPPPPPPEEKYIPVNSKPNPIGLQYGFDDFYDITDNENQYTTPKKIYVSLESRSSTGIKINLMNMDFSTYSISTEPAGLISALTTDAGGNPTTTLRTDVTNNVTITSLAGPGTAKIIIKGQNTDAEQTVISGCDECDNIYIVEVYDMINIENYRVLNLTSSAYNSTTIKNCLNPILKQAVSQFSNSPIITNINCTWDANGNGVVDICGGCSSNEFTTIEATIMVELDIPTVEEFWQTSFTAILPGSEIRDHYYINQIIPKGLKTIYVADIQPDDQFFENGVEIKIGNWISEANPSFEIYHIESYDPEANTVTIKEVTTRIHTIGETFFSKAQGIKTNYNNSYVRDGANTKTWVHEMLHQKRFGDFQHVSNKMNDEHNYSMNVMYPYIDNGSENKNNLCGRPLMIHLPQTGETHYRQWYRLHNSWVQ